MERLAMLMIISVPREVEIDERDRKDYYSPSTKLFADYCASIAERYGLDEPDQRGQILHTDVHDIKFGPLPGSTTELFTISTSRGTFHSRAAVLAIGPGHIKNLPWNLSPEEQTGACHSADMGGEFANAHVRGKIARGEPTNVVVIGGGLSSAQIVDLVVRKGVTKVWYIMRSDLKIKHFDVSLNWVGKFKNYDKAVFWSADSDEGEFEAVPTTVPGQNLLTTMDRAL
ncbi:hypothetical protein VTN31DRAFT_5621 [Thermomyces dupontii]|uniref:uncharacterized protein n=1 Tax=Talaromyces thermophilus TaxID=28565 RepID=UPI0037441A7A